MTIELRESLPRRDWIVLSEMSLSCVVGLHDWERRNPQGLIAEVGMALNLDDAAGGDLSASVDYASVLNQIGFIVVHGRWRLLESMVAAMARHLLSRPAPGEERAQVDCVWIKVTEPDIFGGRAVPSVEVLRDRAWLAQRPLTCSDHEGVAVDSLTETPRQAPITCRSSPEPNGRCSISRRLSRLPEHSVFTIVVSRQVIAVLRRTSCGPTRASARGWSSWGHTAFLGRAATFERSRSTIARGGSKASARLQEGQRPSWRHY